MPVYIAEIRISDAVATKIGLKHGVAVHEVREAFILTSLERAVWDFDVDRGWRVLATGSTAGSPSRRLNAVLYPVDEDDGIWRLGTAMPAT